MGLWGQRGCPSPSSFPVQGPEEPCSSVLLGDLTWGLGLGAMARAEERWESENWRSLSLLVPWLGVGGVTGCRINRWPENPQAH